MALLGHEPLTKKLKQKNVVYLKGGSRLSWGSCSTCRSWMTWINLLGNGLRNKKARVQNWHTKQGVSGRNSHQMCGMILWKARPAKHESLHREELHHGEAHMRAERRRGAGGRLWPQFLVACDRINCYGVTFRGRRSIRSCWSVTSRGKRIIWWCWRVNFCGRRSIWWNLASTE